MKIFLHSILLILALNTQAAPSPEACHTVNIGVVDWTDLHVANGIAEQLLIRLGYEVNLNEQPSMPEIFCAQPGMTIRVLSMVLNALWACVRGSCSP